MEIVIRLMKMTYYVNHLYKYNRKILDILDVLLGKDKETSPEFGFGVICTKVSLILFNIS